MGKMAEVVERFFGRRLNEKGQEVPDPTPAAVPIGFRHQLPLAERIKRMVRNELSVAAQERGAESFEEANDFEVGDDDDPIGQKYLDEDDEFTPNDPHVKEAMEREEPSIKKRLQESQKAKDALSQRPRQSSPQDSKSRQESKDRPVSDDSDDLSEKE